MLRVPKDTFAALSQEDVTVSLGLAEEKFDHAYVKSLETLEGLTEFKESVVEYIGGFVVRQVRKLLKCEVCCTHLVSSSRDGPKKLVDVKDHGGLVRVSWDTNKVCQVAEQCIQNVLKTKGIPRIQGNITVAISSAVLKGLGLAVLRV